MRHTKIPVSDDTVERIERLLTGTQTISRFVAIATEEKIHRMEARVGRAKRQLYEQDIKTLTPLVEDILDRLKKS